MLCRTEVKQLQHFNGCPQPCSAVFGVAEHCDLLLQTVTFKNCPDFAQLEQRLLCGMYQIE